MSCEQIIVLLGLVIVMLTVGFLHTNYLLRKSHKREDEWHKLCQREQQP